MHLPCLSSSQSLLSPSCACSACHCLLPDPRTTLIRSELAESHRVATLFASSHRRGIGEPVTWHCPFAQPLRIAYAEPSHRLSNQPLRAGCVAGATAGRAADAAVAVAAAEPWEQPAFVIDPHAAASGTPMPLHGVFPLTLQKFVSMKQPDPALSRSHRCLMPACRGADVPSRVPGRPAEPVAWRPAPGAPDSTITRWAEAVLGCAWTALRAGTVKGPKASLMSPWSCQAVSQWDSQCSCDDPCSRQQ